MDIVSRMTRETNVRIGVVASTVDERGSRISTTNAFLDHMVATLGCYAGLAMNVEATGDLQHHLLEDVAITLGIALRDIVPATCRRYGHAVIPMDDALVEVVLDIGGRAYYKGRLRSRLYEHVFRSLAENAGFTLHVRVLRGSDRHHVVEAAFKAFGLALQQALTPTGTVFSTKGAVLVERVAAC